MCFHLRIFIVNRGISKRLIVYGTFSSSIFSIEKKKFQKNNFQSAIIARVKLNVVPAIRGGAKSPWSEKKD